jgi:hypothetical protein
MHTRWLGRAGVTLNVHHLAKPTKVKNEIQVQIGFLAVKHRSV